jgi:arylsulfatase A-like enzyme
VKSSRLWLLVGVGGLVVAAALAWPRLRQLAGRGASTSPANVVVVLVDTLRADHLGVYGYPRPTSPHLDRFAREAIVFEQNRSQGTCTFPSANSILTSRYPQRFADQEAGHLGIPDQVPTAATILGQAGLTTVAVSASPVVRRTPSYVNVVGGFDAGFDHFDEECLDRDASCVTERALALLETVPEPFFLYLHYMDPHAPYRAPASAAPRFAGSHPGPEFVGAGDPQPIAAALRAGEPPPGVTVADLAHLRDLYDEEIAYFDHHFARLLRGLEAGGRLGRSVVAVLSDHGEEFFEHGRVVHCDQPFDTLVRTPLVVRVPGVPGGRRIATPVGNVDLLPTILSYLGRDPASYSFDGESLRPLIEEDDDASRGLVFSAHALWRGVSDGRFKLIWNLREDSASLFDSSTDPQETSPLRGRLPRERRRLRQELAAWIERTEEGSLESKAEQAERAERHLRATGYLD